MDIHHLLWLGWTSRGSDLATLAGATGSQIELSREGGSQRGKNRHPLRRHRVIGIASHFKQNPRSSRRNELPTELIDGPLLMGHEHLSGAPIELMQIFKTASRSNYFFQASPKTFNGTPMMAAVGG